MSAWFIPVEAPFAIGEFRLASSIAWLKEVTLEQAQMYVNGQQPGGIVQVVTCMPCDHSREPVDLAQMLMHEEGKLLGLLANQVATSLARDLKMIAPEDWIAGPAILLTGEHLWT